MYSVAWFWHAVVQSIRSLYITPGIIFSCRVKNLAWCLLGVCSQAFLDKRTSGIATHVATIFSVVCIYIYVCSFYLFYLCMRYIWQKKTDNETFFHARHSCKDCMSISCQLDAITHHAHVLAESSHSTWSVCDAEGSNLIWVSSWWCHAWPDTDAPTGIEEVCVCSCSWRTMWRTRYQGRYSADSEEKATGRHLSCYPIWWHLSGEEHRRHQNLDGATRCHAVPHISIMLVI